MNTLVLQTHTKTQFYAAVSEAAQLLNRGELVALPTETVYGLAANAWDAAAVSKIYEVKGRPAHNPIIVHVASLDMAKRCVFQWPVLADKLARAFWPGPLTLVLPRCAEIPEIVTAGGPTVGVRWPAHPFMRAVIAACDFPLAAPSANPAGQLSPTTGEHVWKYFEGKIRLIVDGGACQVGIESTVVDLASSPPRVLRPGMAAVESYLPRPAERTKHPATGGEIGGGNTVLRSPGMLEKHYAPRAKLVVLTWRDENDLQSQLRAMPVSPEKIGIVAYERVPLRQPVGRVAVIPNDAEAFARALYGELHRCDEAGMELIIVESPPPGEQWRAIADRLARASR